MIWDDPSRGRPKREDIDLWLPASHNSISKLPIARARDTVFDVAPRTDGAKTGAMCNFLQGFRDIEALPWRRTQCGPIPGPIPNLLHLRRRLRSSEGRRSRACRE